ncbi:MAG TPA: sulfite exporter TauE/SafE family protein, partial [Kofleriaceae bacterium]
RGSAVIALLAGVTAASALGSVHCLAMCGPLARVHSFRLAGIHALGRLLTYATIGAIAGGVGKIVDLAARFGGIQRGATILAAAIVVIAGIASLLGARAPSSHAFGDALLQIRPRSEVRRAWWFGVLTGLLPCGWLWTFAVTAAGTGSIGMGVLVMIAFWLGTVPAMVGVLGLFGRVLVRARIVGAIAMIALGLGTLALRWSDAGTLRCHHHESAR